MENKVTFKDKEHKDFYNNYLKSCYTKDVYHKALIYCLGIDTDTRKHINRIYDFEKGHILTGCLTEPWQTSGSINAVRMGFNLYNDGVPSVYTYENEQEQLKECRRYTVSSLFCCSYAPFFCQAIRLRYSEYFNQDYYEFLEKPEVRHIADKSKIYKKK